MSEILENNLSALQDRYPEIYEACNVELKKRIRRRALIDTSQTGESIIAVQKDNRVWYLNSRYDNKPIMDCWWKGSVEGQLHYKGVIVLFGLGNFAFLDKIIENIGKDNLVMAYEPDIDVFLCALSNIDLTDYIKDKRIKIYIQGMNSDTYRDSFVRTVQYEFVKYTQLMVSFGYHIVYRQEYEEFATMCQELINMVYAEKNTMDALGEEICDNVISNQWLLAKSSSINQLKWLMEEREIDVENIPAFIISAGPSLDKNIDELARAKGKSFILATDSALRKLLAHNIIPDMVITVDPHKPKILFEGEVAKKLPFVFCGQSSHDIAIEQQGKMFSFASEVYSYMTFNSAGKPMDALQTGGSVANNAFSLAEYLGFKNIIFVGQDLAFTDDRLHASNIYEEKALHEREGDEEEAYAYVEDIHGNQVLTFANFKAYKEWFEGRIVDCPELNVINATEGGANIKGAQNMKLSQVIDEYCKTAFDASIFEDVDYLFSDEDLENYYEYLQNILSGCDKIEAEFNEGIAAYDKLKKLMLCNKTNTPAFAKVSQVIERVNNINKSEPVMALISFYSNKEETDMLEEMYREDDGFAGAVSVLQHGKELLKVYKKALERVRLNVRKLIKYQVSNDIYEITEYNITFVD